MTLDIVPNLTIKGHGNNKQEMTTLSWDMFHHHSYYHSHCASFSINRLLITKEHSHSCCGHNSKTIIYLAFQYLPFNTDGRYRSQSTSHSTDAVCDSEYFWSKMDSSKNILLFYISHYKNEAANKIWPLVIVSNYFWIFYDS